MCLVSCCTTTHTFCLPANDLHRMARKLKHGALQYAPLPPQLHFFMEEIGQSLAYIIFV